MLAITLTLVGKIGLHFGAMTEIERQRAVDLFQRQERIAFLDTFRWLPVQIGIDDRSQRDAGLVR